jgi:hypothetical protein
MNRANPAPLFWGCRLSLSQGRISGRDAPVRALRSCALLRGGRPRPLPTVGLVRTGNKPAWTCCEKWTGGRGDACAQSCARGEGEKGADEEGTITAGGIDTLTMAFLPFLCVRPCIVESAIAAGSGQIATDAQKETGKGVSSFKTGKGVSSFILT